MKIFFHNIQSSRTHVSLSGEIAKLSRKAVLCIIKHPLLWKQDNARHAHNCLLKMVADAPRRGQSQTGTIASYITEWASLYTSLLV